MSCEHFEANLNNIVHTRVILLLRSHDDGMERNGYRETLIQIAPQK